MIMIDLRDDWSDILRRMHSARALGVLLSLDEALRDLEHRGSVRRLSQRGREKLLALAALGNVTLAVHSAEKLSDLVEQVRIPGIWYVANRGFELRDPQGSEIRFFGPEDCRLLDRIHEELLLATAHVAGVRLNHRGPCIALDYEEVDPPQVAVVLDTFRNVIGPSMPQVMAYHSRKTIEARIRSAFDEKAALRYVHRRLLPGTLFFYFGADPLLIEMFKDFRPFDILVEVSGHQESTAKYCLGGSDQVTEVLGRIADHWKGWNSR